jgi:hypothetical protein
MSCCGRKSLAWRTAALYPDGRRDQEPRRLAFQQKAVWCGARPSIQQEANRGEPLVPISRRCPEPHCGLRADEHDQKGKAAGWQKATSSAKFNSCIARLGSLRKYPAGEWSSGFAPHALFATEPIARLTGRLNRSPSSCGLPGGVYSASPVEAVTSLSANKECTRNPAHTGSRGGSHGLQQAAKG